MSNIRQIPLFQDDPQTEADINRHTSLQATVTLFRQHLHKAGKSEHTVKAFASDLMLLGEYLGAATPVGQFTTTLLNRFMDWLENERGVPCSRKSYARRVTTLKVYFKWLHGLGAIPDDPARAVLQRSGPAPLSEVLLPEQIDAASAHARTFTRKGQRDTRPEVLFRLLLETGIKKNEAVRLTPADIDRANPEQPVLYVRQKARNVYKERRIALSPAWMALLDLYLEQYKPETHIFACTARNLEYILTDIGDGAGIPFKVSFEVMRWTCAVRDYLDGMEEQRIREKMGLSESSWHETGAKIRLLAANMSAE